MKSDHDERLPGHLQEPGIEGTLGGTLENMTRTRTTVATILYHTELTYTEMN